MDKVFRLDRLKAKIKLLSIMETSRTSDVL